LGMRGVSGTDGRSGATLEFRNAARFAPSLTWAAIRYYLEAASVVLSDMGHAGEVAYRAVGPAKRQVTPCTVIPIPVSERMESTFGDRQDAVEEGGMGLACVHLWLIGDKRTIERAPKGHGFDFWIKEHDGFLYQPAARLEVTGTTAGPGTIKGKLNRKLNQVRKSDHLGLPVVVVVVDFETPQSRMVTR